MIPGADGSGTITTISDNRVTRVGFFLRKYKLDEFPQIWNVLTGKMSLVGPRPDVEGYADTLTGENRTVLTVRPGITGPASIFFRYEELLLEKAVDPVAYNDRVIWPCKVRINRNYVKTWGFWKDIGYIVITFAPSLNKLLNLVPRSPRCPAELESNLNV